MSMQLLIIHLINNYLNNEVITQLEMKTHLKIPKILIKSISDEYKTGSVLKLFYPDLKDKLFELHFRNKISNPNINPNKTELYLFRLFS
jgi:hypothetical protein